MLWLYRTLFLPALVVLAPGYLLRMRRRGGYGERFGERFGAVPALPPRTPGIRRIWLQAVSVGEVLAVAPLVAALRSNGRTEIYLTTTTSTGRRLAHDRFGSQVVGIGYFPLDWWPFMRRAWRQVQPDLVILTEGERWPEHIRQAAVRGVPVVAVNARLSDRSFRRMRALRAFVRPLLGGITRILPVSAQDEERFRELGFPGAAISTLGNIKLDVAIPPLDSGGRERLRRELGLPPEPATVILGSSTWPGEEAALLGALRATRNRGLGASLLLVPRHAERRAEIESLLRASGLRYHFRSRGARSESDETVDVAVGDTTGELRNFTQLADLVFVGKSLAPHTEGQTPVEAAALARPIILGPGMGNFRAIADDLRRRGAVHEVAGAGELAQSVAALVADESARRRMAAAAAEWHRANTGAVARTVDVIRSELNRLA